MKEHETLEESEQAVYSMVSSEPREITERDKQRVIAEKANAEKRERENAKLRKEKQKKQEQNDLAKQEQQRRRKGTENAEQIRREQMEKARRSQNELNEKVEKNQRDYFLREELKAIQEELGIASDPKSSDYQKFKAKNADASVEGLPEGSYIRH